MNKLDSAALAEYERLGIDPKEWDRHMKIEGVPNLSADAIPRIDHTWSDCNLDRAEHNDDASRLGLPGRGFSRLRCRKCGGVAFEVMNTNSYETSAHCIGCGFWYIVHNG